MTFNIASAYVNSVRNRMIEHNKNWLCLICGGTGTGKTYTALSLAYIISVKGFAVKTHLAFNPNRFMEILNSGDVGKGEIILFDEAGVGMSSREWFSLQNKLFNYVLQTFRHKNIGVIFTTPGTRLIDSNARILLHSYMETRKILKQENKCLVKVYNFQYNSILDKIYRKSPSFYNDDGEISYLESLKVPLPPKKIIRDYEKAKNKYTKQLNTETLEKIKSGGVKGETVKEDACGICKNSVWSYLVKQKAWRCRVCGNLVKKNPFLRKKKTQND